MRGLDVAAIIERMPQHVARFAAHDGVAQPQLSAASWAVISTEPGADHNLALVGGPQAAADLDALLAALGERAAIVMTHPLDPGRLEAAAGRHRLRAAGGAPLMTLDTPASSPPDASVVRATDAATLQTGLALMVEAFSVAAAGVDLGVPQAAGIDAYLLVEDGEPRSFLLVAFDDDLAGVYAMATPARLERRGYGRRLLQHVLATLARPTYLVATPAGEHLYATLGFATQVVLPLHVSGVSTQFG